MKKEVRVIGIDDAPFDKFNRKKDATVIATFFRGGLCIDGIMSCKVRIDGNNSTKKLIEMINQSKFVSQVFAILLDGIAVAGFNVINIQKLSKKTGIPVIVVIRKIPDFETINKTLKKLGMEKKIKLINGAGPVYKFKKVFFQVAGADTDFAEEILKVTCTRSDIPEPIRVAHLIGQGLVFGESKGDA